MHLYCTIILSVVSILPVAVFIWHLKSLRRIKAENNRRVEEQLALNEDERQQMGREVHDTLNPMIAAIKLRLEILQLHWHRNELSNAAFDKAAQLIDQTMIAAREISAGFFPSALQEGLISGLQEFLSFFRKQGTTFTLLTRNFPSHLSPRAQTDLYRIIVELIHNAARHAGATSVRIYLFSSGQHDLHVSVRDNGKWKGETSRLKPGTGFRSISRRAESLGASFRLLHNKPSGMAVHLSMCMEYGKEPTSA